MDFVVTNVTDTRVPGQTQNHRASTFSLFDDDLSQMGRPSRFSLNTININEALLHLIPRAIAYSTGMIDYFFRGDIDLVPDDANMGKYVIRNSTSEQMSGTFELYYDAIDGRRYPAPGGQWDAMVVPAKNASTGALGRSPPIAIRSPTNAKTDGVYMLVFRGDLGNERKDQNSFGAVVGRKVKAVPLEALYIAGVDAQGQAITLRVDENGTQLLSGPDESGVVIKPPSAFDPVLNGAVNGQYLRRKPTTLKQVAFPDGPGGLRYRVLAFQGLSYAGIRDTDTWDYTMGSCCWQAQSADPTIGKFTFSLGAVATDGNAGSLIYVRTYVDAAGATKSANGTVALPPLPGYSTAPLPNWGYASPYGGTPPVPRADYKDLVTKGPVVSSDGLFVHGLLTASTVSTPPVPWVPFEMNFSRRQGTTVNVISLRITLAATPTVAAAVDEVMTYSYQGDSHAEGEVERIDNYPSCAGPPYAVLNWTDGIIDQTSSWTHSGRVFVGAFDGAVRSYRISGGTNGFSRKNTHYQVSHSGSPCDFDIVQNEYQHWESQVATSVDHQMLDGTYSVKSGFGGINDWRLSPNPAVTAHVHCSTPTYCEYATQNFSSSRNNTSNAPPVDVRDPVIVFAPYISAVVYNALTTAQPGAKLMFRGIDISGKDFVADASPLGEMFFALKDASVVIHEPKNGRMPTFVRPSNMVKITAALWL